MGLPAAVAALIERVVYAAARGAVRAWLDVLAEPRLVIAEDPVDADRARADRLRAAANRLRSEADPDTGPEYSPQTDSAVRAVDRNAPTRRIIGGDADHG